MNNETWNYTFAKRRMKEMNISRKELAKRIALELTSLNMTLSGRKPGPQTIKLLSQVLGCTEEELLTPSDHGLVAS